MTTHAKLSASGSHRWLACPGSVEAESKVPQGKSSPAAQEGTCAHELADLVLSEGGNCFDWEGKQLIENNAYTVEREMCEYVQQYVDYVKSFSGVHHYEQRVDFSDWVSEGFGTSDAIIIDGDTIRVIDLKYGKGIRVDSENNPQGLLYALGAYSEHSLVSKFKRAIICIHQPRLDHVSEWEISIPDLLKWGAWVSERAELALQKNAERVPGDEQCQWCAVKAVCPELKRYTERIIMSDFEELDVPNVDTLTDEQIRAALDSKKLIVGWLSAIEEYVSERVKTTGFEGYKLVAGRSLRRWSDEAIAADALSELVGDDAYEKKLLSPAKAEKLLGKEKAKKIADLVIKPEGAPTLAPESDKRPSILISKNDFDCLQS